ncbi:MAG: hypothetical protein J0H15_11440 [Xanthomonadales bacterium]|nr:hypothetical protein [Xanthomonadales bacterium]
MSIPHSELIERAKAEIRAEAEAARSRAPLPRIEPPPMQATEEEASRADGIERSRRSYAIGELTGTDYVAFVDGAFRALLKRPPDEAAASLQVRLLANGASKAEVLGNLRWSPEGRSNGVRIRGLLPRYLLAKLARLPLLGYLVDWSLALAALPLLLRHQRAAGTTSAAQFAAAEAGRQLLEGRLTATDQRAQATAEALRALEQALAAQAEQIALQLGQLREHELGPLRSRLDAAEGQLGTCLEAARDLAGLRHLVNGMNHYLASLQSALAGIEAAAAAEAAAGRALQAAFHADAAFAATRDAQRQACLAALAARLDAGARVLDLGAAGSAWLDALQAGGFDAFGATRSVDDLAGAATAVEAMARIEAASLDAVTLAFAPLLADPAGAARVLHAAWQALKPGACLLVRNDPAGWPSALVPPTPQQLGALVVAAGFEAPQLFEAAVLARRAAG